MAVAGLAGAAYGDGAGISLIPAPRKMSVTGGECQAKAPVKKVRIASIPSEGYELSITAEGVTIRYSDDAGAFYADKTLRQLRREKDGAVTYPCVEIKDSPAFKWRGVQFDDARHFFGKATVKRTIDLMSRYKFNVFHWHLTDNEFWLVDIPGYPELVKHGRTQDKGEAVGPFRYTANDIREVVEYARARHVTVVPELEFPGHFATVGRAYPDFICPTAEKRRGSMCVGNADAVRFAEKALDYICGLFPSEVIHFGGDECSRENWLTCPRCKALMERESMKDVEELQQWLTRHLADYLVKKGKRPIGWDEMFFIRTGKRFEDHTFVNHSKAAIGMCWRNTNVAGRVANSGYEIVNCPTDYCYLDYNQSLPPEIDPYRYFMKRARLTFEKTYRYDPLEGVKPEFRKNVLGGQCCNWAERTTNDAELEWKMWPRALAIAEVLWTYPDPGKRDFAEFSARAKEHRVRLMLDKVNCAPLGAAE